MVETMVIVFLEESMWILIFFFVPNNWQCLSKILELFKFKSSPCWHQRESKNWLWKGQYCRLPWEKTFSYISASPKLTGIGLWTQPQGILQLPSLHSICCIYILCTWLDLCWSPHTVSQWSALWHDNSYRFIRRRKIDLLFHLCFWTY